MKRMLQLLCITLAVLIFIPSCDGNVFVKPDVSRDVEPTVKEVTAHLGQAVDFKLEKAIPLRQAVFNLVQPQKLEDQVLTDDEMMALLEYLGIPVDIPIDIDFKKIPTIKRETMDALLILDKPQDIALVNQILALKLSGNSLEAVKSLYESIIIPLHGKEEGLLEIGNVISIPLDDESYGELTFGDYLAVQMIISLIIETIPNAVVNNYNQFILENPEATMDDYFAKLGEHMVKALLIDKSIILHVIGTYTFLNKYNPSTTILDIKNLGSFFNLEAE